MTKNDTIKSYLIEDEYIKLQERIMMKIDMIGSDTIKNDMIKSDTIKNDTIDIDTIKNDMTKSDII